MVEAYAGGLFNQAPQVAESIIRGQQALKADDRNNPEKEDKSGFREALDKALPQGAFSLPSRTNPQGAYATMRSAVVARYADLTAQQGGNKEFSEDRLRTAVNDVTGGVLDHNGGKLIAPARGMPQAQFDGLIYGISDADLAGVTTLHGAPVTPAYLRSEARLESVGDGQYLVQVGNDAANPLYAVRGANTEMPEPYILDLRGRKPARPADVGTAFVRGQ
jgi:hypothetical protein